MARKRVAFLKKNKQQNTISELKSTPIRSYRDPSSTSKPCKPENRVKLKPACGCTVSSEHMRIRATAAEISTLLRLLNYMQIICLKMSLRPVTGVHLCACPSPSPRSGKDRTSAAPRKLPPALHLPNLCRPFSKGKFHWSISEPTTR